MNQANAQATPRLLATRDDLVSTHKQIQVQMQLAAELLSCEVAPARLGELALIFNRITQASEYARGIAEGRLRDLMTPTVRR